MSAILQTTGPVSNTKAVKNTSRSLQSLKLTRFHEAATELENINLGNLVTLSQKKGHAFKVFVKKPPPEAERVLIENPDLCSLEKYAARYNKPPSKAIGLQLRASLAAMKLVPKKFFM